MEESDCKVNYSGSRVQRVLTRRHGKAEEHVVALNEEEGEITSVEGHDFEGVAAILKIPDQSEIYQGIARVCCAPPQGGSW